MIHILSVFYNSGGLEFLEIFFFVKNRGSLCASRELMRLICVFSDSLECFRMIESVSFRLSYVMEIHSEIIPSESGLCYVSRLTNENKAVLVNRMSFSSPLMSRVLFFSRI